MKCKKCEIRLETITGIGLVHPASDCVENDGVYVDLRKREAWNKLYPTKQPSQNILSKLKVVWSKYLNTWKSYYNRRNKK